MFLNNQIDLLIVKTYDGRFTLTTKNNHCISSLKDQSTRKITHYFLVLGQAQIVFAECNEEYDSRYTFKTVNPLLSFGPLSANVAQPSDEHTT